MTRALDTPPSAFADYLGTTEPKKMVFWTTFGFLPKRFKLFLWLKRRRNSSRYLTIFHTKEEAEAHAVISDNKGGWVWDGLSAHTISLTESMFNARKEHLAGVAIKGYRNDKWVTLQVYPANIPLANSGE
jgi:hypothetical protein